jgi:hypothetical protein
MIQITFGLSPISAESAPEYVKHSATFLRIIFVLSVVTTLANELNFKRRFKFQSFF